MCDIGVQTHLMGVLEKKEDKETQTSVKEYADIGCQTSPIVPSKVPKSIIIPEKEDENSMSDNSFNTLEASKSADKLPFQDQGSENDEDTPFLEAWIPDIEKFISKIKPEKKASTFFMQHKKDQLFKSASQSPKGGSRQVPLSFVDEESTESSSKLASQLTNMLESYKQVCKERDYLKNLLKPYLRGVQEGFDPKQFTRKDTNSFPKILDLPTPVAG
jgi:hypothetical protein